MALTYQPDPSRWVQIPDEATDGWSRAAAGSLARAQHVDDPAVIDWVAVLLDDAVGHGLGDEDSRWLCAVDVRKGGIVLDIDLLDLGEEAPDDVDVDEEAAGQTEEFSAGRVTGKRIIWVSPVDPGAQPVPDGDPLQGQVLYVGRVQGTGYLVTARSGRHHIDLIVDSVPACEQMLATMHA